MIEKGIEPQIEVQLNRVKNWFRENKANIVPFLIFCPLVWWSADLSGCLLAGLNIWQTVVCQNYSFIYCLVCFTTRLLKHLYCCVFGVCEKVLDYVRVGMCYKVCVFVPREQMLEHSWGKNGTPSLIPSIHPSIQNICGSGAKILIISILKSCLEHCHYSL